MLSTHSPVPKSKATWNPLLNSFMLVFLCGLCTCSCGCVHMCLKVRGTLHHILSVYNFYTCNGRPFSGDTFQKRRDHHTQPSGIWFPTVTRSQRIITQNKHFLSISCHQVVIKSRKVFRWNSKHWNSSLLATQPPNLSVKSSCHIVEKSCLDPCPSTVTKYDWRENAAKYKAYMKLN